MGGLMRPYSTGSLRQIGAVTINPDEWPRRCPVPPQLPSGVKAKGEPRSAVTPEEARRLRSGADDSKGKSHWAMLRAAQRGQEAFLIAGEHDRNPRAFSPAYYAYHVNQRPVPWYLRGHRFRLTGSERTGDIEKEERFESRVI